MERLTSIESGTECERLLPLVSALADGEASAEDLQALRPHLKTCLSCRARLREFRAAPKRVAALLPPVGLAAARPGGLRSFLESLLGAAQHKAAALGERAHTAAELATGQKAAAVAASAAALAGGGAGVKQLTVAEPPAAKPHHVKPVRAEVQAPAPAPEPVSPPEASNPPPSQAPRQPAPQPKPPPPPPPSPAAEFAPAAGPSDAPAAAPEQPSGGDSGAAGGNEFGP